MMLEIQQRWGIFLYLRNIFKLNYNIDLTSMWNQMINRDHVIKIGSNIEIMIETNYILGFWTSNAYMCILDLDKLSM